MLDTFLRLTNVMPGLKTKLAAVGAFGLAIIAAWNTLVPAIGFGPCELSPEVIAAGTASCGADLTITLPSVVESLVLALLGIGAANQPSNVAKLAAPK